VAGPDIPLAAVTLRPLTSQGLQSRPPTLLQAVLDRAIALGPPTLDLSSACVLLALPLRPLALEPLGDGFLALERDYIGVARPEAPRGDGPTPRSSISDAIVPCEPHAAGV
jgi:hypothetical protein